MFNQLIESSSHKKELKRRGSFLVFTTATYVVLFAITGVVSIYAYDTHLEQQSFENVIVMRPYDIPSLVEKVIACGPSSIHSGPRTATSGSDKPQTTLSPDHPEAVPDVISNEAVKG